MRAAMHPSLDAAWLAAMNHVLRPGDRHGPITFGVEGFEGGKPGEDPAARSVLNQFLETYRTPKGKKLVSVKATARTIFPYPHWVGRNKPPHGEFAEYVRRVVLPAMKSCRKNRHGTYIGRMIDHPVPKPPKEGGAARPFDQLAHVIERLKRPERFRTSGLEIAVYVPHLDETKQPVLGFPCLQQVCVTYGGKDDGVQVFGVYPSQYVLDRGYGNLLGLTNLGRYLAQQSGRRFAAAACVSLSPDPSGPVTKGEARKLMARLRPAEPV